MSGFSDDKETCLFEGVANIPYSIFVNLHP